MKIKDTPPFLKQTPLFYQPLPFNGKNLNARFRENFKNSNPLFYKDGGWVSNYEVLQLFCNMFLLTCW